MKKFYLFINIITFLFLSCSTVVDSTDENINFFSKLDNIDLVYWDFNPGKDLDFWFSNDLDLQIHVYGELVGENTYMTYSTTTKSSGANGLYHYIVDTPRNFKPLSYTINNLDGGYASLVDECTVTNNKLYDFFNAYPSKIIGAVESSTLYLGLSGSVNLNIYCDILQPDDFHLKITVINLETGENNLLLDSDFIFYNENWERIKRINIPYTFTATGKYKIKYEISGNFWETSTSSPILEEYNQVYYTDLISVKRKIDI